MKTWDDAIDYAIKKGEEDLAALKALQQRRAEMADMGDSGHEIQMELSLEDRIYRKVLCAKCGHFYLQKRLGENGRPAEVPPPGFGCTEAVRGLE